MSCAILCNMCEIINTLHTFNMEPLSLKLQRFDNFITEAAVSVTDALN